MIPNVGDMFDKFQNGDAAGLANAFQQEIGMPNPLATKLANNFISYSPDFQQSIADLRQSLTDAKEYATGIRDMLQDPDTFDYFTQWVDSDMLGSIRDFITDMLNAPVQTFQQTFGLGT